MATVAFLVHPARQEATDIAARAVEWLASRGDRARLLTMVGEPDMVSEEGQTAPLSEVDLSDADVAVSLGGDGTFLRLVPLAWTADVPILGVNFGHLGYLLEVAPEKALDALDLALNGQLTVEDRAAMAVSVTGELDRAPGADRSLVGAAARGPAGGGPWWLALNEMVAEKTVPGHTVRLATAIDGEPLVSYRADGLLVATATGSTAYNFSAGGPVLAPDLRALIVTAVAPHLSFHHSVVLRADQTVTVEVEAGGRPAVMVVDGQEVGRLAAGARITCQLLDQPVRMFSGGERGFAGLLRATLDPNQVR